MPRSLDSPVADPSSDYHWGGVADQTNRFITSKPQPAAPRGTAATPRNAPTAAQRVSRRDPLHTAEIEWKVSQRNATIVKTKQTHHAAT